MQYSPGVLAAGLLVYGWSLEYRVQWIVPIIGGATAGIGAVATFVSSSPFPFHLEQIIKGKKEERRKIEKGPMREEQKLKKTRTMYVSNLADAPLYCCRYRPKPTSSTLSTLMRKFSSSLVAHAATNGVGVLTLSSASALAANALLRCVAAGTLPLSASPLYSRLGYGLGNTLLAFLALAFGLPAMCLSWYGEALRRRYGIPGD